MLIGGIESYSPNQLIITVCKRIIAEINERIKILASSPGYDVRDYHFGERQHEPSLNKSISLAMEEWMIKKANMVKGPRGTGNELDKKTKSEAHQRNIEAHVDLMEKKGRREKRTQRKNINDTTQIRILS